MKPASFDYHEARSAAEAVSLLTDHADEAKVLAGGQSLVPAMNFRLARPGVLIDINRAVDLEYVERVDGALHIGALARHRAFERPTSDDPLSRLLSMAAGHVGHLPIRVRGTFGGSLAHADPAAEWCVLTSLLDAEIVAQSSKGARVIAAGEFFQTVFTTDLLPEELLTEVRIPLLSPSSRVGFTEFSRRAGDFALTMAAVVVDVEGDRVKSARIALGGISDRPVRATEAEQALAGSALTAEIFSEAGEVAGSEVDPIGDIHGSAEYRRDLVRVLTKRALQQAISG